MNQELKYHFASDNTSGICPEAWQALEEANSGYHPSYGADAITAQACESFRDFFETDCEVFFVFNGTAANSLSLASLCQSYHSVICSDLAHVETDECGAPEFFSNGSKLLTAKSLLGKLDPTDVERLITHRNDLHYPRPKALSLSQSTELGTVYRPGEIAGLCELVKKHGMHVHMDGARFANAVAGLGCTPAELTWKSGVDVMSFGATKNGAMMLEAVVFFDLALAEDFAYRRMRAGQLLSKSRYLGAQMLAYLDGGLWLENARRANALAQKLAFERMSFLHLTVAESIVSPALPATVDIVTALHACDTATDDAIRFALEKKAQFIVLVPCCQAEVASVLKKLKGDRKSVV